MPVPGIEPGTRGRSARTPNCWVVPPTQHNLDESHTSPSIWLLGTKTPREHPEKADGLKCHFCGTLQWCRSRVKSSWAIFGGPTDIHCTALCPVTLRWNLWKCIKLANHCLPPARKLRLSPDNFQHYGRCSLLCYTLPPWRLHQGIWKMSLSAFCSKPTVKTSWNLCHNFGGQVFRDNLNLYPQAIVTHVWVKSKLCPLLWGQSYPNTFPWFCFYFLQRSWDSGEFGMLRGRQGFDLRSEDQAAISKFYLPERFFSLSTATLHPVPIHPETLKCV